MRDEWEMQTLWREKRAEFEESFGEHVRNRGAEQGKAG